MPAKTWSVESTTSRAPRRAQASATAAVPRTLIRWAASGSCSQALALARAAAWTTASGRASSKAASRSGRVLEGEGHGLVARLRAARGQGGRRVRWRAGVTSKSAASSSARRPPSSPDAPVTRTRVMSSD